MEAASHPEDVRWDNLRIPEETRKKRVLYSKYIMFCILVVSFFFLGILNVGAFTLENWIEAHFRVKSFRGQMVTFNRTIFSLIITLCNTFLSTVSEKLVNWERHINSTNHFKSYLEKVVVAQFLNSALSLFLAPMIFAESV